MPKLNRRGQAAVWNDNAITKMRSLLDRRQRLIFEISLWTGERMGAIVQLQVSDAYKPDGKVKDYLTFRGDTRKSTRWGTAKDRHVKIHANLRHHLENYDKPESGYLFPSKTERGHITRRGVDKSWRTVLKKFGLEGFSTHSSRRWVINTLARSGVQVRVIAETMAMNIATVYRYLDSDPEACDMAISNLKVV